MSICTPRRVVAGSLAVILALAAQGDPARAQTLRWTSQADALTLDPHAQNEGPTIAMTGMIYEALVTRDPSMTLQPELATVWEPVADGWRFHLREGVRFHGGESFDAQDVAFSIRRAMAPTSDWREQLGSVASVEVEGPLTVVLRTKGPNPILPNQLTNVFIMDEGWAEAIGAAQPQDYAAKQETAAVRQTNGTGPFALEERRPDELTVLAANPDWWGKGLFPGNLARIEYRPMRNPATRVAALLSGDVDLVLDPPLQDLARIRASAGMTVASVPQIRTIFLGMDEGSAELRSSDVAGRNPFGDRRVRLAMNLAVDREAIRDHVMEGLSYPTGLLTPPGVHGSTPEIDAPYPFDPERARALLAEAGYGDGFSVQLDCPNDRYNNDEEICQALVGMYARVGVRVTLDLQPRARHFPKVQNRETDFYMLGWGTPTLDSAFVLDYLVEAGGAWNATGFDNLRLNELVAKMAVETDLAARDAMIAEAWAIVREQAPYVPLHHQVIAWAMAEGVDAPICPDDALRPRFVVIGE
ncbi:ABC transporter substrate-binding protein [Albimonas sp. CAU 1670]|uniref:ABC transporter substrate-binding protein n=1 Tax=Albimonas sp. CAU 1670 TaxID=3032599 RepID=UPI0023DC18B4|nr:ABC transporter substrate-binding protein [Albimonas sp. CAU 1670]MDF2232808.1 ABC transporter substrate-binding protein [Albimonas sp. CAU 1670]